MQRFAALTLSFLDVSFKGFKPTLGTFQLKSMDKILAQLGGLLLGSIPTIIFVWLLYGLYSVLVHKPLVKTLAERRAKTEGAMDKARADIARAEAQVTEYETRLREARLVVFRSQEARRQQTQKQRDEVIGETRTRALKQVEEARAGIEADRQQAQGHLEGEVSRLATEIVRTVLQTSNGPAAAGGR